MFDELLELGDEFFDDIVWTVFERQDGEVIHKIAIEPGHCEIGFLADNPGKAMKFFADDLARENTVERIEVIGGYDGAAFDIVEFFETNDCGAGLMH